MLEAVFLSVLEGLELFSKTLEKLFGFQPAKINNKSTQVWKPSI